jgi:hypothetical protein
MGPFMDIAVYGFWDFLPAHYPMLIAAGVLCDRPCSSCDGRGKQLCRLTENDMDYLFEMRRCGDCHGTGRLRQVLPWPSEKRVEGIPDVR